MLPITPAASWKPGGQLHRPRGGFWGCWRRQWGCPISCFRPPARWCRSGLVGAIRDDRHIGCTRYRTSGRWWRLLSYPFLFEPAFNLDMQSWLWSGAFLLYAAFCLACAIALWSAAIARRGGRRRKVPGPADRQRNRRQRRPGCGGCYGWLLPAVASLMLLATTNHVCQDVAVVPFLWVVPLALYLLSFIICFDHQRWYVRPVWASLAAAAIVACGLDAFSAASRGFWRISAWSGLRTGATTRPITLRSW